VATRFPNIPILPTFGNNDNMNNYIPPFTSTEKAAFFNPLFKTWFEDVPATFALLNNISNGNSFADI
jgi:hypothetical protein